MSLMSNIFQTQNEKTQFVKIHADPFQKNCFHSAHFFIGKNWGGSGLQYTATVKFKKENTTGQQDFEDKNFTDLVLKVEAFIQSL